MRWEDALRRARRRSIETGKRWYVHGYRTSLGEWRYGSYKDYRPNNLVGRVWS